MALSDSTPRCAARKRRWRNLVPEGMELPKLTPGGKSPAEIRQALEIAQIEPKHFRAYCLQAAGAGTWHLGSGHCSKCNGNNQGEGSSSPSFVHGAYAQRTRDRISDSGRRKLFEDLLRDPELLSLRTDVARLRLIQDEVDEQIAMRESPWAVEEALRRSVATRRLCDEARLHAEANDVEKVICSIEQIAREQEAVSEACESRQAGESEIAEAVEIVEAIARVAAQERKRLVALRVMLAPEQVESIVECIAQAFRMATEDEITQDNMETLSADALVDAVNDTLGRRLGILETQEKRRSLGMAPASTTRFH